MLPKPKKIRNIYLDYAAATYTRPEVFLAMRPYFSKIYGNPSSLHRQGAAASDALNVHRRAVAGLLGALPENIIFTGGGTESANLAVYGVANRGKQQGKHIISTPIEHHAVLRPLEKLKKDGWEITYIRVNGDGLVDAEEVIKTIRKDTVLISIMYANNEMGATEPIAEIGRKLLRYRQENKTHYPFFHTDACQAAGYLDLNVEKLHIDLMTLNGGKIYGPKGVGALYARRGVLIESLILGGGQEYDLRAGSENLAGIAGLAKAMELAEKEKTKESARLSGLTKYLWEKIQKQIPNVRLNGPALGPRRLANNLNIGFAGIENEALLLYLDECGIMCSAGSACAAKTIEPSHVLKALKIPNGYARGSLRFTFGRSNTKNDADYLMKYLPTIVEELRKLGRKS